MYMYREIRLENTRNKSFGICRYLLDDAFTLVNSDFYSVCLFFVFCFLIYTSAGGGRGVTIIVVGNRHGHNIPFEKDLVETLGDVYSHEPQSARIIKYKNCISAEE